MRRGLELVSRHIFAMTLALAEVLTLLHPGTASAQTDPGSAYPKAPVKIIVGLAPGGSNDIIARVVAQKLSERLGGSFIVENKRACRRCPTCRHSTRSASRASWSKASSALPHPRARRRRS